MLLYNCTAQKATSINSKPVIIFLLFYIFANSKYVKHTKDEFVTAVQVVLRLSGSCCLEKRKNNQRSCQVAVFLVSRATPRFFVLAVFVTMNLSCVSFPSGTQLILPPTDQTNAIHWLQSLKNLVFLFYFLFFLKLVFHVSGSTAATVKCN